MKEFTFKHTIYLTIETFVENTLPKWVSSKEYKWFLDEHILTLNVSESTETDFHQITRAK